MSRGPSPAPTSGPPLPPKDTSSSFNKSYTSSRPTSTFRTNSYNNLQATTTTTATPIRSGYVNNDLAAAVRDSVVISRHASKDSLNQNYSDQHLNQHQHRSLSHSNSNSQLGVSSHTSSLNGKSRRSPSPSGLSLAPPLPTSTSAEFDNSHRSIVGESGVEMFQPALPSAQMAVQNRNPFADDEVEPAEGRVRPPGVEATGTVPSSRTKFTRSTTGNTTTSSSANPLIPSPPGRAKMRRSLSSDSYGAVPPVPNKTLIAGQQKAAEDKKGSRHADLIDTWDPTGMGSAMWHHSGPYDAAAPSRNVNLPPTKAPMHAFNGAPILSPPRTGPTTISLSSPPATKEDLPPVPAADKGAQAYQRGHRATNSRRISGGGLSGQYSTSMPTSGGYFPDTAAELGTDEAGMARKARQQERENKRRALKAAWGTDIPEPYEDFGASPSEGTIDLSPDVYSPELNVPSSNKPLRSPGLRLGLGPRTPPIIPEGSMSPEGEYAPPPTSRSATQANNEAGSGVGVKRTKSLMQKIKSMVRPRSSSVESYENALVRPGLSAGQRSMSMNTGLSGRRPSANAGGAWPEETMVEEDEIEEVQGYDDDQIRGGGLRNGGGQFEDADEEIFQSQVRPGELGQWGKGDGRERRAMSEGRRR